MSGLIHVVMFVGALTAFTASAIAGLSALEVASLTPKGGKLWACLRLGRWQFAALEASLGPSASSHLIRYRRAFLVFCATLGAMLALFLATLFLEPA